MIVEVHRSSTSAPTYTGGSLIPVTRWCGVCHPHAWHTWLMPYGLAGSPAQCPGSTCDGTHCGAAARPVGSGTGDQP